MNYTILKRELLIALRGSTLTQTQLSRKLRFSYNQVGKWEADSTQIKWEDFYGLCTRLKIPLEKPMKEVFLSMEPELSSSQSVLKVLNQFHSHLSKQELAQRLGCHPSGLKRWLSGQVRPNLELILAMMDLRPHLLATFISKIANINSIPCLSDRFEQEASRRQQEASHPMMTVIQLALGLEGYKSLARHSDSFIAETAGLSVEEARSLLKKLLIQNRIQWIHGKYENSFSIINTHGDPEAIAQMKKFWTQQALKRFGTVSGVPANSKNRPNFQSCFVASISKLGMNKISERLHLCQEEIYQIVSSDKNPDQEIRIIMMDSFSPDDVPSDEPSEGHGLK